MDTANARKALRALARNWVLWRDAGDWQRLRGTWHDDGCMVTTWCDASADDFIALCRKASDDGALAAKHRLNDIAIEFGGRAPVGSRAIVQSGFAIIQRAIVDGKLAEVTCTGRFYDFVEHRGGRWGIVLRQPVYEKDRIDPVDDPGTVVALDEKVMAALPSGYRHLAYVQIAAGLKINLDLPGVSGEAFDRLEQRCEDWLVGTG